MERWRRATCEVRRGAICFRSTEPTSYRYNLGYEYAFPQQFISALNVPDWWLSLLTECRIIWRQANGDVLRDYTAEIPARPMVLR